MANNEELNVFQMVLADPLPHLSDPDVERLLLMFFCRYAKVQYVHELWAMYGAASAVARDLGFQMYREYSPTDILHKLVQLRDRFARFRWFINKPRVHYDEEYEIVWVDPDYYEEWAPNQEPEEYRNFRENGLKNYRSYKFGFVTANASLLWYEPVLNGWQELPIRESDRINEGFDDPEADGGWRDDAEDYIATEIEEVDESVMEVS